MDKKKGCRKLGKMPIAGQEIPVKNETFGSKFQIPIGRVQPKAPIIIS